MAARSERSGSGKSGPRAAERRGLLSVGISSERPNPWMALQLIASAPCARYRCCYCSASAIDSSRIIRRATPDASSSELVPTLQATFERRKGDAQRRRVDLAFGPIEASPGSKVSGWPQAHGQGFLALCHRQVARAGTHRTGLDSVPIAGRAAPEGIAQAKALPMCQPATMAHQ